MAAFMRGAPDPDLRQVDTSLSRAPAGWIRDYAGLFRRQRWLIAAIVLLIFLPVVAYVFTTTPLYTSNVRIFFEQKPSNIMNFQAIITGSLQDEGAFLAEVEILSSRHLAARVVRRLDLERDPEFNPTLRGKGLLESTLAPLLNHFASKTFPPPLPPDQREAASATVSELEAQQVVDAFLQRLDVAPVGRSRVVEAAFTSESSEKATRIANAVAEEYLEMQFDRSFEVSRRASDWLAKRISEMRAQVEEAEQAIAAYRSAHGLLQGQQNEPLINQQISELAGKLTEASMDRITAEAALTQVRRDSPSRRPSEIARVLDSTLVQRFREQELQLARKEAELSMDVGPRHPRAVQMQAEKKQLREEVEGEVKKLVRALEDEVVVAKAREDALQERLAALKVELSSSNVASAGLYSLERRAAADKLLLERFEVARSELVAQETPSLQSANGYIMSPAVIPTRPSHPRKVLMLAGGLVGALLIAGSLAIMLELNDVTFKNAPQLEAFTGAPVLSLVPMIRGKSGAQHLADEVVSRPHSLFAEAMRTIYTRIALSAPNSKEPSSIVFLSAHNGEGKTTIALSTARLIALQTGRKVLFMDADLRRSEVAKRIGLEPGRGLCSVLAGRCSLAQATRMDPISPLHLLLSEQEVKPAGIFSLSRDKLQPVITAAKAEYDFVIIDSPPLFALADAQVLSGLADSTVLVVQWGRTLQKVVSYAISLVSRSSGKISGVVLSQVRLDVLGKYGEGDSAYGRRQERHYYSS